MRKIDLDIFYFNSIFSFTMVAFSTKNGFHPEDQDESNDGKTLYFHDHSAFTHQAALNHLKLENVRLNAELVSMQSIIEAQRSLFILTFQGILALTISGIVAVASKENGDVQKPKPTPHIPHVSPEDTEGEIAVFPFPKKGNLPPDIEETVKGQIQELLLQREREREAVMNPKNNLLTD
jgi:hypothetical protein